MSKQKVEIVSPYYHTHPERSLSRGLTSSAVPYPAIKMDMQISMFPYKIGTFHDLQLDFTQQTDFEQ